MCAQMFLCMSTLIGDAYTRKTKNENSVIVIEYNPYIQLKITYQNRIFKTIFDFLEYF